MNWRTIDVEIEEYISTFNWVESCTNKNANLYDYSSARALCLHFVDDNEELHTSPLPDLLQLSYATYGIMWDPFYISNSLPCLARIRINVLEIYKKIKP